MMPTVRVDKGAIKFVFKGADIMCPGLTSAGGDLSSDLPEGAPVAILAEGKDHALAVGLMKMSAADMCVLCAAREGFGPAGGRASLTPSPSLSPLPRGWGQ
jgi:predicted RNA-binding protein (TIGR00451 family)